MNAMIPSLVHVSWYHPAEKPTHSVLPQPNPKLSRRGGPANGCEQSAPFRLLHPHVLTRKVPTSDLKQVVAAIALAEYRVNESTM